MAIQSMQIFEEMKKGNAARVKQAKEDGRRVVGTYCTYAPEELILAAGAIPIGLCGTKKDPIPAAEEILPRNLCPLIKSSYGFAATDTCPFFMAADLIVGETTCDGKKKMFELMAELKPLHLMHLPQSPNDPASLALWTGEVRRFKEALEEAFQVKITDAKIREAIRIKNEENRARRRLHELNRRKPALLSGVQVLTASWLSGFVTDRRAVTAQLHQLCDEVEELAAKGHHFGRPEAPRLLVTGCPQGLGSEKVIRLAEENGAVVVAQEFCTGYKTLPLEADPEAADPLASLAQKYLRIPCSCMTWNTARMELVTRMIAEFEVDGVIDLTWQACHTYNIEAHRLAETVREKTGRPYLHLETDYSPSDTQQLNVRIAAFLEMLG